MARGSNGVSPCQRYDAGHTQLLQRGLTVSILPDSIFSVVAAMLPPLRCRSHRIVRRSTCGNICCILSTATSRCLNCDNESRGCWLLDEEGDEKKRYRTINPESTMITTSEGRLIWSLAIVYYRLTTPEEVRVCLKRIRLA